MPGKRHLQRAGGCIVHHLGQQLGIRLRLVRQDLDQRVHAPAAAARRGNPAAARGQGGTSWPRHRPSRGTAARPTSCGPSAAPASMPAAAVRTCSSAAPGSAPRRPSSPRGVSAHRMRSASVRFISLRRLVAMRPRRIVRHAERPAEHVILEAALDAPCADSPRSPCCAPAIALHEQDARAHFGVALDLRGQRRPPPDRTSLNTLARIRARNAKSRCRARAGCRRPPPAASR